jgi:hypothetical protein
MRATRLPVESATAFRNGVLATRVGARRAFDAELRQYGDQEVDQESGLPVWVVDGYDIAAMMAPPIETKSGRTFREPAEVRIYVIARDEPVIPDNQVNGMRGVVQFYGLMVTPWMDDKGCKGLRHDDDGEKLRCGCQIKLSFRAYGMEPFGE